MIPTTTILDYPTGTAATNFSKKFHAFAVAEEFAFRDHHEVEIPDAYE